MRETIYDWLTAGAAHPGDFATHVLASILAARMSDDARPLERSLNLEPSALAAMVRTRFPGCAHGWRDGCLAAHARAALGLPPPPPSPGGGGGDFAADFTDEIADLTRLLYDNRSVKDPLAGWMAAMVAAAALRTNHLWQDLGLPGRADLSRLMGLYFAPLAARNVRDMKWKKFFYRTMCEAEGLLICKSPVCDDCDDFTICFGHADEEAATAPDQAA